MTVITLSEKDAALFVQFQQLYENIERLIGSGAFDIRNGSFVAHIDGQGKVRKVDRHDSLFHG